MDKAKGSGKRAKRVTLADVAARAGVSVATASVAITGRPSGNCRVSPAVAEKIRRAARTLRYRPNLQARNLSTQRTHTVAMLVKRTNWQNAMFFLSAAQRVLRQRGFTEIFSLHPQDRIEDEREQLEMCIDRRVEAIIMLPVIDRERRTNLELINQIHKEEDIPVIQLGQGIEGCVAPNVISDDIAGVREAVRHLHSLGHRDIAHVTIDGYDDPHPLNPYRTSYLRAAGYAHGVREFDLTPQYFVAKPDEVKPGVVLLYDMAVALCEQIAAASPRPTAITCYADYMAAGIASGLSDLGITVPQEISIVGYGNQGFGLMLRPQLSTLAPQYERMGEYATEQLLGMIDGGEGQSIALPPTLTLRQSIRDLRKS